MRAIVALVLGLGLLGLGCKALISKAESARAARALCSQYSAGGCR